MKALTENCWGEITKTTSVWVGGIEMSLSKGCAVFVKDVNKEKIKAEVEFDYKFYEVEIPIQNVRYLG